MAVQKDDRNKPVVYTTDNTVVDNYSAVINLPAHSHSGGAHTHTWHTTGGSAANPYITPSQPTVVPNPFIGGTWHQHGTTPQVVTPTAPHEGMTVNIGGKLYRYSQVTDQWIEVVDADDESIAAAPAIPVKLDARAMLAALQEYRDFLAEIEGLDNDTAVIVADTLFGLGEAIEALEKL